MAIALNSKAKSYGIACIASGNVNKVANWTLTEDEEKRSLGDNNWAEFGRLYLGIDSRADATTKEHYKYPIGKNGKVYRAALISARNKATAKGLTEIVDAATTLLERIDGRADNIPIDDSKEMRTLDFSMTVETRADGRKMLRGHAAIFNEETVIGDWFREVIRPGAFIDTIVEDDQRALFNHDPNYVLGRKSAGTLELSEDKRGLSITIDPPDTPLIRDLVIAPIERGDINQMSFSFRVKGSDGATWEAGEDGLLDLRVIKKCRVFDVSPVTFPAYAGTDIAMRSQQEWRTSLPPPSSPAPTENDRSYDIEVKRKKLSFREKEELTC